MLPVNYQYYLLKCVKPNIWYIFIPYTTNDIQKSIENQDIQIISLDPGVRTFQTGYSPNGHLLKIGDKDDVRIVFFFDN